MYANVVPFVRTKLTWFVIGPVLNDAITANGGLASNTIVRPVSLSVIQTWLPSGVAAMFGQNGLSCLTRPTILRETTANTTVSGLNDEQTYPYFPSGEKICMPGPPGVTMRAFSRKVLASITET